MSQIKKGIRTLLEHPFVYDFHNWLVGADNLRKTIVKKHIGEAKGKKILDIGCGSANMLPFLAGCDYTGFDTHEPYIEHAKKMYGDKGKFFAFSVNMATVQEFNDFDIVLAVGILHHLDDKEAKELFEIAHKALKKGGKLITVDPCYTPNQSKSAKSLISKDRGQMVRTEEAYKKIATLVFSDVKSAIYDNLLRIPYTHIIMECVK